MQNKGLVVRLGLRPYREVWDLQKRVMSWMREGRIPHTVLLVEHPPVYTIGRSGSPSNMLLSESARADVGAEFIRVDRGGDITFHGPGQLVCYPILDLSAWRWGAVDYVRALEQLLIELAGTYGVRAERVPGRVGVWTSAGKVAAIGVRISRGVTSHGFALNVTTDLSYFGSIIPCGISDAPVTSLEQLTGLNLSLAAVEDRLISGFGQRFDLGLQELTANELAVTAGEEGGALRSC
jgi:lipoyl(octanoyl) transferase